MPEVAYQSCLSEAFRQSPLLIERWCNKLAEVLHDRSRTVNANFEKRLLQDAIAALKKNQSAIEQSFTLALTHAIAEMKASVKQISHERTFGKPNFSKVSVACVVETRDHDHADGSLPALGSRLRTLRAACVGRC